MANKTFSIKLDLNGQTITPKIEMRRNDHMTNVLSVQVLENGVPVDITDWTPVFECLTPDKTYVRDVQNMNVTDAINGKFEYTVTDNVFAVLGTVDVAYFAFEQSSDDGTLRFTTPNFYFVVIRDVMTGHDSVDDYMSDVLALIDEINDVKDDLQRIEDEYDTLDPDNYATILQVNNLSETKQVITFDSIGRPSKVEHRKISDDSILREDTFEYVEQMIYETRTLDNGKQLKLRYNLSTFEVEVTE